jgi:hypothetical protein
MDNLSEKDQVRKIAEKIDDMRIEGKTNADAIEYVETIKNSISSRVIDITQNYILPAAYPYDYKDILL